VRAETPLARSHISISSVAVELAEQLLGELRGRPVVIIGAGETSELTAQALAARGVATVFVANRHADRARSVAERFGGRVVGLDRLPETLEVADIVVASTASPHAIVGAPELELVMEARGHRPLLLIDIAVPRDIDPRCGELEGVTLRDIDDLQSVVERNLSSRAAGLPAAEAIVEEEIVRFARWLGQLDARPTIAALRERGDEIVEGVLAENAGRWETASPRDLARVEALARAVVGRLLHEPTIRLRSLEGERSHGSIELLRDLFALREGPRADAEPDAHADVRELRASRS
jgi:glutamyl-tRNA reductase